MSGVVGWKATCVTGEVPDIVRVCCKLSPEDAGRL